MKKLIFTILFALATTITFADSVKNYKISNVNINRLSESLNLDSIQSNDFKFVFDSFKNQMNNINDEKDNKIQKIMFDNAIKMNTNLTRQILNKDQYKKYLYLLNLTINNRGLNKDY